ncbi:hypothetical protein [Streptomyces sp. YS415]|uniref:hypothetical protein n=1 Tax=Streptomyces sp. YS415 TaxID=2944806 RepID=UPI0020226370|nr:hypothetical protein [Streptomyces sp. YS415]MCL7430039.1 hypothetical protein [Streptomyces sp. YS415]
MTPRRRFAALWPAALCALTSCGIPTTGVVEAGGPASGVPPMIRVYYVVDGTLAAVPRRTTAPVDVAKALETLLMGPTDLERGKRITTRLPLPSGPFTATPIPTATDGPGPPPRRQSPSDLMTVTEREDGITVRLALSAGRLSDLVAAQIICTATAAQRVADPGAEPVPVTVTGAGGRRVESSGVRCPDA